MGVRAVVVLVLAVVPAAASAQPATRPAATRPAVTRPAVTQPAMTRPSKAPAPTVRTRQQETKVDRRGSGAESPLKAYKASGAGGEAGQARGWKTEPGSSALDILAWVPRVVLFVPNLAFKALFWPLSKLALVVDRYAVAENVIDFLYNDARTAGVLPLLSIATGFGVSAGAKVFHNDLLGHAESLSASVLFGGRFNQSYEVSFSADRFAGSALWLQARTRYEVQPAELFYGIGNGAETAFVPGSLLDPRQSSSPGGTRFAHERFLGLLRAGVTLGRGRRLLQLGVTAVFNHRAFGPKDGAFPGPSIGAVFDTAKIPGFRDKQNILEVTGDVVIDTRNSKGKTSSGVFIEIFGGGAFPLDRPENSYGHFGGEGTLYVDLYKKTRVLQLRAALEGVLGSDEEIPFIELPRLGGGTRLRGFLSDRFRDKLAAFGTVQYRYAIHEFMAAELFVDVGKVERDFDELFGNSRNWKLGVGGGIVVYSDSGTFLRFDVGYGFGEGIAINFTFGGLRGLAGRSSQL